MAIADFALLLLLSSILTSKCSSSNENNPGISESSRSFIQTVLESVVASAGKSDTPWLQHGVIIRSDQRRSIICTPEEYLVEDIILWDPLSNSPNLNLRCPNCFETGAVDEPVRATRWKDGGSSCDQPRRLYGLNNNVLLVSRVYMCQRRHQTIAHDPAILSQVRHLFRLPFVLFHRGGITRELSDFIISHANADMTMSDIQTLWLQTIYEAYAARREVYFSTLRKNSHDPSISTFPEFQQRYQNPGEKVIASCIARNYFMKEKFYKNRMCQMTADRWLSCDHTFKVSANIGFWFNKRWVKLYDTLFIVLNEEGIVLTWKLCRGTKFTSIEDLLNMLKRRLELQGKGPSLFFLDNCCHWRNKVTSIFPDIAIKLDIFHAIQRVVSKIPKKKGCSETLKQLRRKMIDSFKMTIRDSADKGKERTMPTPSPEVILNNIQSFMNQWSTVVHDSVPLLPASAVREIEKLKQHVLKGCLSDIPPSGGTHGNEALHKTLNKGLKRTRIGLELALAFLGMFFYKWNERKLSRKNSRQKRCNFIRPVEMYFEQTAIIPEEAENFGASLSIGEITQAADCDFSDDISDAGDVVNCINYLLEESSDTSSDDFHSSDDQNEEENQEDCSDSLSNVCVAGIIQLASNFALLSKQLENIKGHASLARSKDHLIYLKNVFSFFTTFESRNDESHNSNSDLDSFLLANNMQRIAIPGDGNCFFVALATMILQQLNNEALTSEGKTHLESIGVITTSNLHVKEIATALRRVIVDEWLVNKDHYEPFLTSGQNYYSEAKAFLQEGHFASQLGNAMPLAVSNALRIPIVVFTSMSNFPVLPVSPRERVLSENPICLVYDMNCAGHYDAVASIPRLSMEEEGWQPLSEQTMTSNRPESLPHVSCRCGQGANRKKQESVSCHEYRTGCKCYQNVLGCNDYCQCINCCNPRGIKVNISQPTAQIASRKRRHHENTTLAMSGKSFSEQKAGGTTVVHWTLFEELVLMGLILALMGKDLLEPEILHQEYNRLVNLVESTKIKHCLGKKTQQQVARKFSTLISSKRVFEKLMKEQARLNNGE